MSTGDFIIDKYKMLSPLATGTTTQVWEVTEVNSPKRVAMKLLLPEAFKIPANKTSLKHEHKAGKVFDHPNIIKFHELVLSKTQGYFIMELFRAPNLKQQIKTDLNMVHVRFKRFVELACLALDHVHEKGWLHKDIKPDNLLINKGSELKLIDFSLSSPAGGALSGLFGGKGAIQGTRTYMAPEQILNKKLSFQTDLYSLGITMFEMLTGKPPFFGGTPKALLMAHLGEAAPNPSFYNKNVTPEMDRIVSRLLSKKPANRHKRAAEVWGELRAIDVFKEAVRDYVAPTEAEKRVAAAAASSGESDRLDSRADHLRQEAIRENPELGAEHEAERAAFKSRKAASAAATAKRVEAATPAAPPAAVVPPTPAWPAAAMGYPQPMPGMPMPFPGYPPGMPGYGMPPGYMPGMPYPYPQQPMMPPMMPPPMMPPPMMPPPMVAPPMMPPVAPQPVAPQPAAPAPAQARPTTPTAPAPAAPRPATPAAAAPVAKPKPAAAKPKPAAAPANSKPPSDGFNISDLDGFDQLESTK
ncbi:MAG: serine/threonine protein kinase [Planctomycetales bacterium]|nr:serine/threonine protein kinase [Planctomycetales bacterium]